MLFSPRLFAVWLACLALVACPSPRVAVSLAQVEETYADAVDAVGVLTTIDSGLFSAYQGEGRAAWEQRYRVKRSQLVKGLAEIPAEGLSPSDLHALSLMRASLQSTLTENPYASASSFSSTSSKCEDAAQKNLDSDALRAALYSCFDTFGNKISFQGRFVTRDSAIALLARTEDTKRRKALFLGFVPLWEAVNGHNEPDSPYRRRIKFAAAEAAAHGSRVDGAAKAIGQSSANVERWLEQILDTWRQVLPDRPVEPWDYRFSGAEADRALASAMPLPSLLPINEHYYRDLGVDLKEMGVLYDIDPRPGKAPVTYANFVTMGRLMNGTWRPTVARVSASYSESGLYLLNMLVHENGHVVHYCAIHNRPAFMDIGNDDIFTEAFADVTSWNVYDPDWQRKYLGRGVSELAGLRSQFTMVTLEVAWALFEARMLRNPDADPNAVWTDITGHYLHIVPHPELSWWAQRVQLTDTPGYMINYGLGAVITADLRKHIRESIGPFNTGNPRWYRWVSEHLLRFGTERETPDLLRDFLGRPVSPDALLEDIRRLSPQAQMKSNTRSASIAHR
jgi:hypothetical protein